MRNVTSAVVGVLALAVALPLAAGEGHHCTASAQDCLNHMKAELEHRGWVGIELDDETMQITRVVAGSPAEGAGFRVGDVLKAVNGVEFSEENSQRLKRIKNEDMTPGRHLTYTVERSGQRRNLDVTLAQIPEEVLAQWVGEHMLKEHAQNVKVASKD